MCTQCSGETEEMQKSINCIWILLYGINAIASMDLSISYANAHFLRNLIIACTAADTIHDNAM